MARLTLGGQIAKMLQNLTNKPNYSKESFMLPLNSFVEDNKHRINKFFYDLCDVDDFHEQLEVRRRGAPRAGA